MAVLGPRPCARALSSCGKWGPLLIAVRGPLTIAASPVAEHRLQTRRLSSCGSRAQSLRGMWDPPRPGLEPVSPALAGKLSTTAPPGKPLLSFLYQQKLCVVCVSLHIIFDILGNLKPWTSIFYINLFFLIFILGCIGSSLLHMGLSPVEASRGYSLFRCAGFSFQWLLLLRSRGSKHAGFSSCGVQAQ